jgi:hypothetical protein
MKLEVRGHRPVFRVERAAPALRTAPATTSAGLLRQLADVISDVPLFLVTPLLRRWHRTWGATPEEVAAAMPGDDLLPRAQYRCTRAITVRATPGEVWPWLVQVGVGRAGWYADDLLDNFARPSASEIIPELQEIHVGQWLPWIPHPSERTACVVDSYSADEWLLWRTPNRTWAWRLVRLSGERTRLITRMHVLYEWHRPLTLLTVLLMEVADFAMMRRMLRGIRDRAETEHMRRASTAREALPADPGGPPSPEAIGLGRSTDSINPPEQQQ